MHQNSGSENSLLVLLSSESGNAVIKFLPKAIAGALLILNSFSLHKYLFPLATKKIKSAQGPR